MDHNDAGKLGRVPPLGSRPARVRALLLPHRSHHVDRQRRSAGGAPCAARPLDTGDGSLAGIASAVRVERAS